MADTSSESVARWHGRHSAKDILRREIWLTLESENCSIGSPWYAIPNFHGAEIAAERLQEVDAWKAAKVVKSNPDSAQAWIRLAALEQGKRLYIPVPELVDQLPYILLDPVDLKERNIDFKDVMYSQ